MNQKIETFSGTKTAKDFVDMPLNLATKLITRSDFPASIEILATTLATIFNYYGRRSICKMYAANFDDVGDTSTIKYFLGTDTIKALNAYMLGWFDKNKVSLIDELYKKMILTFVSKYNLS